MRAWYGISAILLAGVMPTVSAAATLTIRAERSDPRLKQQMALVLGDSSRGRLTINSNFLLGPSSSVELGHFEVDLERSLGPGWRKTLSELMRLSGGKTAPNAAGRPNPHATRLYIGSSAFSEQSSAGKLILKVLRDAWRGRKPLDVAEASFRGGPTPSIRFKTNPKGESGAPVDAPCTPSDPGLWSCEIPGYGVGDFKEDPR